MSKGSAKGKLKRQRTAFEWTILLASVAVIVAILISLASYSLSFKPGPPDLRVIVRPNSAEQGQYVLTVTNRGGNSAEDVAVEVSLGDETQDVEFRVVAKGDSEEARVVMSGDGQPQARIKSYKES